MDTDEGALGTVHGTAVPRPTRTTNHNKTAAPTNTATSAAQLRGGRAAIATPRPGNVPTKVIRPPP
ncbi:hypothetical protein MPRM_28910 [Mycobacterium parmense]|uniref:Uncharacterized protein n=1 Tax=Mycobacterium parmense TaxID=185642 RepID=A0A7I7YV14_9MYCO|nr:hypothetical protein MPRM_28910 [Mycobacterium parmense]